MLVRKIVITAAVLLGAVVAPTATAKVSFRAHSAADPKSKWSPAPVSRISVQPSVKPKTASSRAEQLKAIETEYQSAWDAIGEDIRAGKIKPSHDGGYPEIVELGKRFAPRLRRLIDANPKDEVALDAIVFGITKLNADAGDPKLYELVSAYHLSSDKLIRILRSPYADVVFLRSVAAASPIAEVRARATFALAARLADTDHAEAERLLEGIRRDPESSKLSHHHGNLGKGAADLLYEVDPKNWTVE
jgi:hypothetical protein